ncbi:MAG: bile acid:sodium symporter family protein [Sinimarinibacterium flocculans]|uniref:BASS family bile acid:Na+ symporter n=1 Tax=Sinimarinibacterium flocculans TaxID=985250 RepID=A0A318EB08_9GAMM|nr:bile acid:sodium symporter family protein [Sinimarinibacterium flocculans]PXV69703.1 BASS family bile acid:Na+ symporter [Sinimarinibacterium flocculans]
MTADPITTVFLPVALGFIMFGLGLSLRIADFTRVLVMPRAVIVGLACQVLLLPAVCVLIAHAFALEPALAVGLMLLAASPGGATANLYSHLANGDVALNITLTAINSVLAIITLPIIVNLSMLHFFGEGKAIPLQFAKVVQVFVIVLGPVALGMLLNAKAPALTQTLVKPVKWLSILFLVAIVALAVNKDSGNITKFAQIVGAACLAFNLVSLAVGYVVPRLLGLGERQAIAIGMEIGIHNGTLAIAVALSPLMLNNPTMAIPPAVYSIIMFFTAAAFGWWANRRLRGSAGAPASGS